MAEEGTMKFQFGNDREKEIGEIIRAVYKSFDGKRI